MLTLAAVVADVFLLTLQAPITTWDEGIPLGNGRTGALLWGGDGELRISVDRGDLWDLRPGNDVSTHADWSYQTLVEAARRGDEAKVNELTDDSYNHRHPTKLPPLRLVVDMGNARSESFQLDMRRARGIVRFAGGGTFEGFVPATGKVAVFETDLPVNRAEWVRPKGLDLLEYPLARQGSDGVLTWIEQECVPPLRFAAVCGLSKGPTTRLAFASVSSEEAPDPLAEAKRRVSDALQRDVEGFQGAHEAWWHRFWDVSAVNLPNERLQRHYNLVRYFYGAASREGSPPMPLQGVWTADSGGLPPWKGDYHNDLNTQTTYLAQEAAGLDEAGKSWLEFNWKLLPNYRRFAREFFKVEGAVVPGVMDLAGNPLGGWGQYAYSPTCGAWVAHQFYRHWKYTLDPRFLKERAYPFTREVGEALLGILQPGEDGRLRLPLSSSPEIFDNSNRAWLKPNSNFDQSIINWLFPALSEMASAAGAYLDAARWRAAAAKATHPLWKDETGALGFVEGLPYFESHRHFSHAIAFHPLEILTLADGPMAEHTIRQTLALAEQKGTSGWTGYSFAWFACMQALAGEGDKALRYLADYERAFTLRNGFHANGDQSNSGLSSMTYRPFTLEGNFLAMEAVHKMLLQSQRGQLLVFPAVPGAWQACSFRDLRAEGGLVVSARREGGRTTWLKVTARVEAEIRLRDPLGAHGRWSRPVRLVDGVVTCPLRPGESLEGHLTD